MVVLALSNHARHKKTPWQTFCFGVIFEVNRKCQKSVSTDKHREHTDKKSNGKGVIINIGTRCLISLTIGVVLFEVCFFPLLSICRFICTNLYKLVEHSGGVGAIKMKQHTATYRCAGNKRN